ncbi:DUF6808 domain-containing protein [Porphyromonas sp.]|uniref:DUF6808 domain-containing protein n=1 Tax=Porphyromonas sp. TaxID=1924944 RepID=UPI0026DC4276|nr:hypothetical protein [Porphyromonas sp.]MDO4771762.1 hypothetical protein [Porphyromonas sp.]
MKKNIILVLLVLAFVLSNAGMFIWNRNIRDKQRLAERNVLAALDTIHVLKDKNGKLYAENASYLAGIKELEKMNEEMHENINSLQKNIKRHLATQAYLRMKTRDTIIQKNVISYTLDSLVNIRFSDEVIDANSFVRIHQDSVYLKQFVYKVDAPLDVYFTKDYEIIAQSKNDNITFTKLNSFVDPMVIKHRKPRRWGLGIQAGIGATSMYDSSNKNLSFGVGPYVGIGISYQLLQW